ncbi:MAG: DUF2336 domain-containing protein [Pseudomonadota bacterium]
MTRSSNLASSTETGIPSDQLFNAVSQLLVATRKQQSRTDRLYANELTMQLIAAMDDRALVKTAQLLAKMAEAPEELQRAIAFTSLAGAEVILASRHTGDAVLMEAASKDLAYRRIIAKRASLSEPVVNRLLFHEEQEIENILLPRAEVPLSKNRMERLVNRASSRVGLATLLTRRSDLNARLSLRLFWSLETDGRRAVLDKFNVDPGFAADVFTQVLGTNIEAYGQTPLAKMAQLITRAQAFEKAGRSKRNPAQYDQLILSMRSDSSRMIVEEAAREGMISEFLATRIINDAGGEPLTVFAAAMNVSEKGFAKVLSERPGPQAKLSALTGKDKKRLEKLFQTLGPAAAAAILSYWDIDLSEERRGRADVTASNEVAGMEQRLRDAFDADNHDPVEPERDTDQSPTDGSHFSAGGRR